MNIVIVSHAQVVPENRARWRTMAARHPDVTVNLIVPQYWHTGRYGTLQVYLVPPERDGNFRVWPLPVWKVGDSTEHFYQSPDLLLRYLQPDILAVYQELGTRALFQVSLYRKIWARQAKLLFFSYDNIGKCPRRPTRVLQRWFVFREADAAIAGNEEVRNVLARQGFRRQILVQTELGANEGLFAPGNGRAKRRDLGLTGFTIGYVGALIQNKGVLDLFAATQQLTGEWALLFIGDGVLRSHLEMECVEKGLGKRVHITGVVNRAALPALYRCMDVLVLPSRTAEREGFKEQFGVVLVEAMLSQVPVIGSDSGAIPEVIGDSGLIFPEGDIGALTAALQRLRGDPGLCKELAHRGRVRALGRFSAAALADETYHFCCELLASKLNVDW